MPYNRRPTRNRGRGINQDSGRAAVYQTPFPAAAMHAFLPAVPLLVLLAALLLKRGAVTSAMAGIAAVAAVALLDSRFAIRPADLLAADLPVVLILTLSVALVIAPGQIFNAQLQAAGIIDAIGARIERVALSRMKMASVIVLGAAPALESLTGFGVSLFFTVPVLVQLFPLRQALLLSLLGMNIMPWGTLALATLLGAQLAGAPFAQLAFATSLTSFAVFPVIGGLIFFICRAPGTPWRALLFPLLTGLLLSGCLVFYNAFAAAELAGVCAGLTAAALMLLAETLRRGPGIFAAAGADAAAADAQDPWPLWRLLTPYCILIALIAISRLGPVNHALQNLLRIESGGVQLAVFTSPGVFIGLSAVLLGVLSSRILAGNAARNSSANSPAWRDGVFARGLQRAGYPVAAIALFVVFAQLHRASGLFEALAARLVELELTQIALVAPLLGMLSGYATGSNVGGNALFMALQSDAGRHFEQQLAFAAAQNSAAGHAVFMSLPIILLALSIAAPAAAGAAAKDAQTWLIRRALLCAPLIYAALVIPFLLLIR
ncbi:MAG: L-lactate permease [Gammaproteobacteria bacterium]|nr:L-lactate permease [Gammaproteobacteria bacterium]